MDATEEIRRVVHVLPALDQHAHLLAGPGSGYSLEAVLSEGDDPNQLPEVRHQVSFVRAIRELAAFLGVAADLGAVAAERSRLGWEDYTRRLFDGCGIDEMLVDDGLSFPGALSLSEHARVTGCSIHRILRIERSAEEAATGWPPFAEAVERFGRAVSDALEAGAVGLKTIAAYRAGLELPRADHDEATQAYSRWRGSGSGRLVEPPLVSFFLAEALTLASHHGVPLQVHTGLGDRDLALHRADPTLLRPILEDDRYREVQVVLLHCHPFIRQAAYLTHVYPQVHMDLSVAMTLAPHRGSELLLEALELAPASKILFATDGHRLPEIFFVATRWWREALGEALAHLVHRRDIDGTTAQLWAEMILSGNARRVYGTGHGK